MKKYFLSLQFCYSFVVTLIVLLVPVLFSLRYISKVYFLRILSKDSKLMDLSAEEITSLNERVLLTPFPRFTKHLLFLKIKKEFLFMVSNSQEKKFLSVIVKGIDKISSYDLADKDITKIVKKVFIRYHAKIYAEVNTFDKIEKPYILTSLIDDLKVLNVGLRFRILLDQLHLKIAMLLGQASIEVNFEEKTPSLTFHNKDSLISRLTSYENYPGLVKMVTLFQKTA